MPSGQHSQPDTNCYLPSAEEIARAAGEIRAKHMSDKLLNESESHAAGAPKRIHSAQRRRLPRAT
jgi:hypothetical protein